MSEPSRCDVWLCRLEGDEQARVLTASKVFAVDVRAARHILTHLPRLAARDLPRGDASALAARLRSLGGVVHVCATGESPDFERIEQARTNPVEPPAERAAQPAPERGAEPGRARAREPEPELAAKPAPAGPGAGAASVTGTHATQDAAMAHWPADATPCAWETSSGKPPPVPKPVRHSAARVAWTLVIVLSVTGTAAAAFWQRFGSDVLAVSIAEPHTPPPRRLSAAADRAQAEHAAQLAPLATAEPFVALAAGLAKSLGVVPEPLRSGEHVVGVAFEVSAREAEQRVEALYLEAHAANASLVRTAKGGEGGFDRLALLPTTDLSTIVQVIAPHGQGATTAELVAWLRALHAARAIRVLGVGEHFVEGRFEVPARDAAEVTGGVYACPGLRAPEPPEGARLVRPRERFACAFLP